MPTQENNAQLKVLIHSIESILSKPFLDHVHYHSTGLRVYGYKPGQARLQELKQTWLSCLNQVCKTVEVFKTNGGEYSSNMEIKYKKVKMLKNDPTNQKQDNLGFISELYGIFILHCISLLKTIECNPSQELREFKAHTNCLFQNYRLRGPVEKLLPGHPKHVASLSSFTR